MTRSTATNQLARSSEDLESLSRRVVTLQAAGMVASCPKIEAALKLIGSHLALARLDLEESGSLNFGVPHNDP